MANDPINITQHKSLFDKLDTLIEAHRNQSIEFALLLLSVNKFRHFNITHGFQAGDNLLIELYNRIRSLARKQDYVLRVGNAEFAILVHNIQNEGHATLAAIKLLSGLDEPFIVDGTTISVSAHAGVALFPDHGRDSTNLLKNAESALIDSRQNMPPYSIFSESNYQVDATSWGIESELQMAIDLDQFELFFQPQIHLETGRVFGAEALIRWKHPERGYVRPDYFIPVAEQSGQIHSITNWTIHSALWLIKEWPETPEPMNIAVNLSPKIFESRDHDLVEYINSSASIFGTELGRLTLEVTESALMEDVSSSIQCLEELKSLGVNISIDDFGTGYSSMTYFKNIPAHELKIDRSFVSNMLENSMDRHIVKSIINLAQGFDLLVVAEGVDDQDTFDLLSALGCDIAQGYFIAKPMPQDKFITWLNNRNDDS